MLAILMDRSGSMSSSHCAALRAGAKIIGQVFADSGQAPFEHFYAISYDHEMKEFKWNGDQTAFERFIDKEVVSRGGNDEQSVFERVRHLSNTLPDITSLTAILFSDGGFMCGPHLK